MHVNARSLFLSQGGCGARADTKAKVRAVEAGIAFSLARVLAAKLDDNHMLAVRARMLISDLLRVQDMQVGRGGGRSAPEQEAGRATDSPHPPAPAADWDEMTHLAVTDSTASLPVFF